jgi:hypothetical protein
MDDEFKEQQMNAFRASKAKTEGKSSLGVSTHRCENNVNICVQNSTGKRQLD